MSVASNDPHPEEVRQRALLTLTAEFVQQGHPEQYAQHMAMASIFQADLDLRNAQLNNLLAWLQQEHSELYAIALERLAAVRAEFEQRVQNQS